MSQLLLVAAVVGLVWYSKRKNGPQAEMCNTGACVQPTTASANPREQPIILDRPVNTALRDDRPWVGFMHETTNALHRIREAVQYMHHAVANAHPGIAIGAPAVITPTPVTATLPPS